MAYPQIIRWMVDNVLQPKKLDLLLIVVGVLFIAFILQGVASSLRYYLFTMSGERMVLRLRQKLFEKRIDQRWNYYAIARRKIKSDFRNGPAYQ